MRIFITLADIPDVHWIHYWRLNPGSIRQVNGQGSQNLTVQCICSYFLSKANPILMKLHCSFTALSFNSKADNMYQNWSWSSWWDPYRETLYRIYALVKFNNCRQSLSCRREISVFYRVFTHSLDTYCTCYGIQSTGRTLNIPSVWASNVDAILPTCSL